MVGASGAKRTIEEMKIHLDKERPELVSSMSKSGNIAAKIYQMKRKSNGPNVSFKSLAKVKCSLPENLKTTADGQPFLRYCEYLDADKEEEATQLIMIFMSDQGKWVGERSRSIFMDGTFKVINKLMQIKIILKI